MTTTNADSKMDEGKAAIKAAGGLRALARLLGITHESILKFERFPYEVDLLGRIDRIDAAAAPPPSL
jgi:hypothetical protein